VEIRVLLKIEYSTAAEDHKMSEKPLSGGRKLRRVDSMASEFHVSDTKTGWLEKLDTMASIE
jgi:hypothetical protein